MDEQQVTVTTETKPEQPEEQTTPETSAEAGKAEVQAGKAEDKAEQAAEESREAESQADRAEQAAERAEGSTKETSSLESSVKALISNFDLVTRRVEQISAIVERTEQDMTALMAEMRATMELSQDQIAAMADAADKLVTVSAALVRLHKEQTTQTE